MNNVSNIYQKSPRANTNSYWLLRTILSVRDHATALRQCTCSAAAPSGNGSLSLSGPATSEICDLLYGPGEQRCPPLPCAGHVTQRKRHRPSPQSIFECITTAPAIGTAIQTCITLMVPAAPPFEPSSRYRKTPGHALFSINERQTMLLLPISNLHAMPNA